MPRQDLIQVRRGTAAQWTSANPTLDSGEFGFETDTNKLKCGDGSTDWNSLDYISGSGGDSVQNNYSGTAAPATTDDTSEGYSVGSVWIDVTNDNAYICVDATEDAAVWEQINGSGSGGIETTTEAFTAAFKTDKIYFSTGANEGTQAAVINFTVDNTSAIINGGVVKDITSNGDAWNFSADFGSIATGLTLVDNQIIPDDAVKYRLIGYWNGSKMDVSVLELQTVNFIPQLNAPVLSTATTGDASEIDITFTDTNSSPNETGVAVYYREDGDTTWILHGTTAADATSYTLDSLTPNEDYNISLIAVGSSGVANDSNRSNILTATSGDYDVLTGLVDSYNFETDASSRSGTLDGTEFNTPTHAAAKVGNGVTLNGTNQYITLPDNDGFSFTDGAGNDTAYTIMGWLKATSLSGVQDVIIKRDLSSNNEWQVNFNGSVLQWRNFNNGGTTGYIENTFNITSVAGITTGVWFHLALVYTGNEAESGMTVYINKVAYTAGQNTVGSYTGMINGTRPVFISRRDGGVNYFNGSIDELKFYKNRAFTPSEIEYVFDLENAGTSIF